MQTAQTIIKDYRRKRVIVCVTVALVTLVLTLGIRFISQRNINQDRIHDFTHHTVRALDKVLLSLEAQRETLLSLVGIPCSEANLILRKQAAILQTVRSIALIQDGILYCSSVFGSRNVPVSEFVPELPVNESRLLLLTDRWLVKGSPVLIQWSPVAGDGNNGV
ncbi:CSS-motif domain-containing protein, partial [Enterobacter hormaechei subsp. oharae]|nr:CSS-motif domain-containing protein [Enterobacter hormaechei subsp. oharae]